MLESKMIHTICPAEQVSVDVRIDLDRIETAGSNDVYLIKDGFSCERMKFGSCKFSQSEDFSCPVYDAYTP